MGTFAKRMKKQPASESGNALAKQIQQVLPFLNQLRAVMANQIEELDALKYETMRSRAVQLRFAIAKDFPETLGHPTGSSIEELGTHYLNLEEKWRAEYDALVAMARLGSMTIVTETFQGVAAENPNAAAAE